MPLFETIYDNYQHVYQPATRSDIPRNCYMVYVLGFNDVAIVTGHGRQQRAKVIFDDLAHITSEHFKTLLTNFNYRILLSNEYKN